MNFLSPGAFLFALALPVVIVFYLLKRKRVVKLVSSTLLWQKFLAETQANAPFQRLRKNWLLFLQLLMLALVVFALSRPFFKGSASESRLRVVILDGSGELHLDGEHSSVVTLDDEVYLSVTAMQAEMADPSFVGLGVHAHRERDERLEEGAEEGPIPRD